MTLFILWKVIENRFMSLINISWSENIVITSGILLFWNYSIDRFVHWSYTLRVLHCLHQILVVDSVFDLFGFEVFTKNAGASGLAEDVLSSTWCDSVQVLGVHTCLRLALCRSSKCILLWHLENLISRKFLQFLVKFLYDLLSFSHNDEITLVHIVALEQIFWIHSLDD